LRPERIGRNFGTAPTSSFLGRNIRAQKNEKASYPSSMGH